MSTESSHKLRPDGQPRRNRVEYLLGAVLVALLVAPLAVPAVLGPDGATTATAGMLHVLGATIVGYLVGLTLLTRRVAGPD
jgi:hypothetical protein